MATITITCTLWAIARDVSLGDASLNATRPDMDISCVGDADVYHLADDATTANVLDNFEWGETVTLDVAEDSDGRYRVLSGRLSPISFGIVHDPMSGPTIKREMARST